MPELIHLLLVDDDDVFRKVLGEELRQRGHHVATAASGQEALTFLDPAQAGTPAPEVTLLDLRLPDLDGLEVLRQVRAWQVPTEIIVLTGHGTIDTAIQAIRLGAFDYIAKPCPMDELEVRLGKAVQQHALVDRAAALTQALAPGERAGSFVGVSAWHRETIELIRRVAPTDASVLILGETGTGKDVVARLLHAWSARRDQPFVVLDCASLHEELLQSELFGHEAGAFTGAHRARHGLFEVADQGTIFLDEIGEMSLGTQVKLLRVLETSSFRRLGGTRELSVDVRVIAATNRDLQEQVASRRFRDDLYFRLSTVNLHLAPLRERPEDIEAIARHHLEQASSRFGISCSLPEETLEALRTYPWPGNVRELLRALERATILSEGPRLELASLPEVVRAPRAAPTPDAAPPLCTLEELERQHIAQVLAAVDGHRARAAEILGISERNLYRKLRDERAPPPAAGP
jgi:DNA-binding NtrC family response regulator